MNGPPGIAVTLGPCDDMRAEVFFRVPRSAAGPGGAPPRLAGTLVGPECPRSTTLPVTARLVDLGPPPGEAPARSAPLVARAVLTEPAFWTPELPNLYRLEARVECGDAVPATYAIRVGLRRLGVRGRSFRLDGRRWVPRGVRVDAVALDVDALRREAATAVVVNPDAAVCGRADTEGVAVIAVLDAGPIEAAVERIAAWAIHPAVVMALLPAGTSSAAAAAVAAAVRGGKGTLQLGWTVDGSQPPPGVPVGIDWLAVTCGREGLPHAAWREAAPSLPLVACGGSGGRAGCDALQARLATWMVAGSECSPWDWAGYVVW